ncbi:MAG: c-type cytochrome, partial [Burkholderiaceae bacterium]|nr:c-type cytochrome [Burkholderiaceae bacterium]
QNLHEFADYFAGLHPPYPAPQAPKVSPAELERARNLVMQGDPGRHIPACSACHGERLTGAQPSIPSLVGLSRDYLVWQFGSWKDGKRKAAAPDCMAQIAQALTPQDIDALTSWIGAQPVPADMSAAPPGAVKLPVACGSYSEKQ